MLLGLRFQVHLKCRMLPNVLQFVIIKYTTSEITLCLVAFFSILASSAVVIFITFKMCVFNWDCKMMVSIIHGVRYVIKWGRSKLCRQTGKSSIIIKVYGRSESISCTSTLAPSCIQLILDRL